MNYNTKEAYRETQTPGAAPGTLGAICGQLDHIIKEAGTLRDRASHIEATIVGARPAPPSVGNPNVKAVQNCFIDRADEMLADLRGVLDAIRAALASIEEKL